MDENKRAHLQMIQAVINRLSQNSFLLKGWSVALVSALMALAAKDSNHIFIFLAYLPAVAFWCLDAYFLMQERIFRALYDQTRNKKEDEIDFSMSTSIAQGTAVSFIDVLLSKTLVPFHGVILLSIITVMILLPSR